MRIDLRTVMLVLRKELSESLRDKRTLFVALILPVLVYPLVFLGFGPLIGRQQQKLDQSQQLVAVTGADADAAARAILDADAEAGTADGDGGRPALLRVTSRDPAADLASRKLALWAEVPEGFDEAMAAGGTGKVVLRFDGSDDRSRAALRKWMEASGRASQREVARRMREAGRDDAWLRPIDVAQTDVAPPDRSAAWFYGRILALLLVLMTLTSSFYPAVDAVAGEKERGTMETLLVAPCGRTELVLGKFLAVMTVTLAAALLNLGSLAFSTGSGLATMTSAQIPPLRVTAGVLLGVLALLVPMAALFSAIALALSTLARSIKEAQHYLSPLVMLVMPLAMVVLLPNLELTPTLAAVPVANCVLFFRDLLVERIDAGTAALVLGSTIAMAALAIWGCVILFLREETLFRGPEGSGKLVARPAPRATPTAAGAVFLFAASLAALWYAQGAFPASLAANVAVTQLCVILVPCALLAWWARHSVAETFRTALPGRAAAALLPAVVAGAAIPVVNMSLQRALFGESLQSEALRGLSEAMQRQVQDLPAVVAVLVIGVLPALCEEALFRGYVLSGFRSGFAGRGAALRAVAAASACFALFHILPERWPATFLVGLVLGWVVFRTGSIWPAVAMHAANNAVGALAMRSPGADWALACFEPKHASHGTAVIVAAGMAAAGVAAVFLLTRRPGAPDGGSRGT
ncbi:MAG: hypothetical protein HMLKMBBP_02946 [Planctomycetes bacterium]|nr:hypothetical protein [Planctomycetota bacterium]